MTPLIEIAILIAALAFAVERVSRTSWARTLADRLLFRVGRRAR